MDQQVRLQQVHRHVGKRQNTNFTLEFWLGSHARTTSADQVPCTERTKVRQQVPGDPSCNVKPNIVEQRRPVRPPIQPRCSKGDIMIRDLRTWHAGMPNESTEDRIMIAIGYQVREQSQPSGDQDTNMK